MNQILVFVFRGFYTTTSPSPEGVSSFEKSGGGVSGYTLKVYNPITFGFIHRTRVLVSDESF